MASGDAGGPLPNQAASQPPIRTAGRQPLPPPVHPEAMEAGLTLGGAANQAAQYGAAQVRVPANYNIHTGRHEPQQDAQSASEYSDDFDSQAEHHMEDPDHYTHEDCEETTYSGAMATIIKDLHRLAIGSKHPGTRYTRIAFALSLVLLLIGMQLYVLCTIKTYVTSPAVRSVRNVYDSYQKQMYHGYVKESGFGFSLGIGGPKGPFFDPTQFEKLSNDMKGSVCLIPFSQPGYLSIILFIWCLSVVGELKQCKEQARWLWDIPTKKSLKDMIGQQDDIDYIIGLPPSMKFSVFVLVILPRCLTAVVLLWLGCRWLAATLDFTEVLINSIALAFVIHLNSLFYMQLTSDRSKRENSNVKFDMSHSPPTPPSTQAFVGTIGWAGGAIAWIYIYIYHLQLVLPGYQWDVRGPCTPWVAERFNFWRI